MKSEPKNKPVKKDAPQKAGAIRLPKPNKGDEILLGLWLGPGRSHKTPKRSA